MSRELPARPNLDHLKNQAKDLLNDFRRGNLTAIERLHSLASLSSSAPPKLADAQHAVAREYGFETWAKLKEHVQIAGRTRRTNGGAESRNRGERCAQGCPSAQTSRRA
jgi:hypothetical protein